MIFQESTWNRYIDYLRAINETAARKFTAYLNTHDISTETGKKEATDYAVALAQKYGESAAALSCEMYDAVAEASGAGLQAAEPADLPTYGEVAKTVNGMLKQNQGNEAMGSAVGRLVKRTGVDTTIKNAIRDGAEWAWIPHGETCSFCLMLASNGWQRASKKALKGGHAEHIHANCDCTYAVRFDHDTRYAGYDPDKYREIYESAEGNTWEEKLNSMRRAEYAKNPEKYRAQNRESYERVKEKQNQPIITDTPKKVENPVYGFKDVTNDWLKKAMPHSFPVKELTSFTQDGETYIADGINVKLMHNEHEKEVARMLERKLGGILYLVPKVEKPENIQTPDYLFRGERYDLKTPEKINKKTFYNAIHSKREQADNFILDITKNQMSIEEAKKQIEGIFNDKYTTFVKRIILIKNNEIIEIDERLK